MLVLLLVVFVNFVGLVLAGPLYKLGGAHFPFGFGVCITSLLLFVMIVLKRRPAMQPQCRQR